MKLTKIKLCRFRCFGDSEQIILFNDLTALIGNNSSGKTAALSALCKLFSDNSGDRILQRRDFFVDMNTNPEDIESQDLYIETVFTFDELIDSYETKKYSIPPFFESLVVDKPDGTPYLRIRLEATWEKTSSAEGSIESKISYITCPEEETITDAVRQVANRHDLDRIRMIYVPAMRDPSKQLKNVSGTMMFQVMSSINWSETTKTTIKSKIQDLNTEFLKEKGVDILNNAVHDQWKKYDSDSRYSNAELRFNSTDIESSIKKTEIVFSPTVTGKEYNIDEMGDGLRSLFYISLVNSILDVEDKIRAEVESGNEERSFVNKPPVLTIVAVEEPENHIAPHLIGKLISKLNDIAIKTSSQTIITSHSPAIVKRIEPEDLRYFRLDQTDSCTEIKNITLPSKEKLEDQYKYIKEAVKAYPELYFAKLVILGEGDSEEIVLPKFFDSCGKDIDSSGISVVPLGGRHINHFWRLLNDLEIPHITLLDLDRERAGGGWGRIKYVLEQLIKNGLLECPLKWENDPLIDLENMNRWDVKDIKLMQKYINRLENEKYKVFFSSPLDLDFMMLEHYEEEYKGILSGSEGPYIPEKGKIKELEEEENPCEEYLSRVEEAKKSTLKKCSNDGLTYTEHQLQLMIWYDYFFLNRGKPSTHILALSKIEDLSNNIPPVINRIIKASEKLLKIPSED